MKSEEPTLPPSSPAATRVRRIFEGISSEAKRQGLGDAAAEALIGIDASGFALQRRMMKRELVRHVLGLLELNIEQAEFETMTALSRLKYGIGVTAVADLTIGDIAAELLIDPSRASRLVAALVQKGFIRREAAQDDGRKSILVLAPAGLALLDAFLKLKWQVLISAFAGWEERDIFDFERLFSHYVGAMGDAVARVETDGGLAVELREKIASAVVEELASRR